MRRFLFVLLSLLILTPVFMFAQDDAEDNDGYTDGEFYDPTRYLENRQVAGGAGFTWIDGQPYTTFTISPDIAFGKYGVGLHLQFLFDNNDGFKFRNDEYTDGEGILRAIRYLRYGHKYDKQYFRVGTLDRALLANGFLMWNYNNGSNYDKRRIGLVADIDLGKGGFESVIGSLGFSSVQGGNLYIRPFQFMENPLPVLKHMRIYGTYVFDNEVSDFSTPGDSTRSLAAFGVGADLRWLNLPILKSAIYADYGSISDFGSGTAVGIRAVIPDFIGGLFSVGAKFEKRFLGAQFQPNLFGPLYELQRLNGLPEELLLLEKTEGYFGELSGHVINKVRLVGNFQKLNGLANTGILHLEASAPDLIPSFAFKGYYDKFGIESFEDARTLDERSLLSAEVGYYLNKYILLGVVYQWYWVENEAFPGTYTQLERVEPRISFVYNF